SDIQDSPAFHGGPHAIGDYHRRRSANFSHVTYARDLFCLFVIEGSYLAATHWTARQHRILHDRQPKIDAVSRRSLHLRPSVEPRRWRPHQLVVFSLFERRVGRDW